MRYTGKIFFREGAVVKFEGHFGPYTIIVTRQESEFRATFRSSSSNSTSEYQGPNIEDLFHKEKLGHVSLPDHDVLFQLIDPTAEIIAALGFDGFDIEEVEVAT